MFKRIAVLGIGAALLASPAWAQSKAAAEPEQDTWGLDFSMGGLLGPAGDIGNAVPLPTWNSPFQATAPTPAPPGNLSVNRFAHIGARYRLSDDMWFRTGFTLGFRSDSNDGKAGNVEEATGTSDFMFGLEPGVEYELAQRGRVRAVAGAFLSLGYGLSSRSYEASQGNTSVEAVTKLGSFWVGVIPMVGGQIDIVDGFSVGAEYRMNIAYATKSGSVEQTTSAATTQTQKTEFSGGAFQFQPAVFALLASFRF